MYIWCVATEVRLPPYFPRLALQALNRSGCADEIPRVESRHTLPILWARVLGIQETCPICRRVRVRGVRLQGPALDAARTVDMRRRDEVGIFNRNVATVPTAGAVVTALARNESTPATGPRNRLFSRLVERARAEGEGSRGPRNYAERGRNVTGLDEIP